MNRFRSNQARGLMALTMEMDPAIKESLHQLFRMGAKDIRPDYMLIRRGIGYQRQDDPAAWNATIPGNLHVSLLRGRDGVWFLNG